MKYADENGKVRTLIAKKHPFKRVENYFLILSSTKFSWDQWESQPDDSDSSNETDTEPEPEEECLWKLNPLVTSVDKLDFKNTANVEGEWYINENLNLAYLS